MTPIAGKNTINKSKSALQLSLCSNKNPKIGTCTDRLNKGIEECKCGLATEMEESMNAFVHEWEERELEYLTRRIKSFLRDGNWC